MSGALEVTVDAEAVNKYVAERILESALGEALKEQIDKAVSDLSSSYRSPIEPIIHRHVQDEIARLIREEYAEQIAAVVREKVTEQFTANLIDKAFEAFERRAYA